MKYLKAISLFVRLLGTRNYYQGIDKPSLIQWLFTWRIGINTAYKVSKLIHLNK